MFSKLCKQVGSELHKFGKRSLSSFNKSSTLSNGALLLVGLNVGVYALQQYTKCNVLEVLNAFQHNNPIMLAIDSVCLYYVSRSIQINAGGMVLASIVLTTVLTSYYCSVYMKDPKLSKGNVNLLKSMIYFIAFKYPNEKAMLLPIPISFPIKWISLALIFTDAYRKDVVGLTNIVNGYLTYLINQKAYLP